MHPDRLPLLSRDEANRVTLQSTTFALDVVSRFFCNTWDEIENQAEAGGRPFDAIVVGSGMYGAYTASKLYKAGARHGFRTLVLEAGPFLITEHIQNIVRLGFSIADTVLEKHWSSNIDQENASGKRADTYSPHHVCIGGKSIFWGGWSPRLKPNDLAEWPADARAWLEDNYREVENELGVDETTDFISGPLYDHLLARGRAIVGTVPNLTECTPPPIAVQGQPPQSGLFSFDKFSSLPLLIDAIREDAERQSDNRNRLLFLVPRARVIRMVTQRGAVREIVAWVDGRIRRLPVEPHCAVVLAATTMNSTRLALESFPTTTNRADELMGRNLMAHLRGNFTVRIRRQAFGVTNPILQVGAVHVGGEVPEGRFHFQVYAAANVSGSAEEFLYRMIPHLEDLGRITASQDPDWINVTVRLVGEMEGSRRVPVHDPTRSWLDLSPFVRDVFGDFSVPTGYVNLVTTARDRRLWNQMDAAAFAFVFALANNDESNIEYLVNGRFQADRPADLTSFRDPLGSTYHECGTLWMGDDPARDVTDANGHFHHVTNAYCVDQSIFPTSGSANPVLTGVALSKKIAAHIVSRFESAPLENEPEFRRLFDGTLNGWRMAGAGRFDVIFDSILESVGGPGLLWYESEQFGDFVLKVDWQSFSIEDNSGVYIRVPRPGDDGAESLRRADAEGYEIQIDEKGANDEAARFGQSLFKTGAIYKLAPARRWAAKALGRWNTYEIAAQGSRIEVKLNGETVSLLSNADRSPRGHIGFQNHHTGSKVQFRNLRIRTL